MADQWLSIVEYARTQNISDMTVRRRIKNGKLQAVLRDGKYYIPLGDPARHMVSAANQNSNPISQPVMRTPHDREQFVRQPSNPQQNTNIRDGMLTNASYASTSKQQSSPPVVERKTLGVSDYPNVPNEVKKSVYQQGKVSIEATKLLEFCDRMLESTQQIERRVRQQYQSQIDVLTATNKAKDLEILQLSQQVEDLQLLVDIIDRNK